MFSIAFSCRSDRRTTTRALTSPCASALQLDMLVAACRHEIDGLLEPADASRLHAPSATEPTAPANSPQGPRKPPTRQQLPPLSPLARPMPHAGQAADPVLGLGIGLVSAGLPAPETAALWAPTVAPQRAASDGCEGFRSRSPVSAVACAGAGARAPYPAPAGSGPVRAAGSQLRRSASDSFSFHIPAAPLARSATPALGRFTMPQPPAPAPSPERAPQNLRMGALARSESQTRLAALLATPKQGGDGPHVGFGGGHDLGPGALGKFGLGAGASAVAVAGAQQISAGESLARFSAVIAQAAGGRGGAAPGLGPAGAAPGLGGEAPDAWAGAGAPDGVGGGAQDVGGDGNAPPEGAVRGHKVQLIQGQGSGKGAASCAESESGTIAAGPCCSPGSSGGASSSPASAERCGQAASPFAGWAGTAGGAQAASESAESVGDSGTMADCSGDPEAAAPPSAGPQPAPVYPADPSPGLGTGPGERGAPLQLQRVSPGAPFGSSISVPESAAPPAAAADEATSSAASSCERGACMQAGPGQHDHGELRLPVESDSADPGAPGGADAAWFTLPQGVTVAGQAGGGSASGSTASGSGSGTGTLPGSAARGSADAAGGGGSEAGGAGAGSDASDGDSVALGWEAESACSRISCDGGCAGRAAAGLFLSVKGITPSASLQRSCTAAEEALPHPNFELAPPRRALSLGSDAAPGPAPGPLCVRAPLTRPGGARCRPQPVITCWSCDK